MGCRLSSCHVFFGRDCAGGGLLAINPAQMTKYILIQNDGEIETNSFELIGASTKRNQEGKIGFFGSGLKYSIAYMMRKSIEFRIFSGEQELNFTTIQETLKGQSFERICINGKPTSYTTTMGPTWTEDWFVFREIYCNALDEEGCQIVRETENINPVSGKTRIYISLTGDLIRLVDNWDRFFCGERESIVLVDNVYTSFMCQSPNKNIQQVQVFHKTDGVLFRRGIRVYSNKNWAYDYSVMEADINEDRTAKNSSAACYMFVDLMAKFIDDGYVKSILRTGQDDSPCEEYEDMCSTRQDYTFSDKWITFSKENLLIVKEISGRFVEQAQNSAKEVFYIPSLFARLLKKRLPNVEILGMGRSVGDVGMTDIDRTPKMDYLLKDVLYSLSQMNYSIPFDIFVVQFESEDVLGQADLRERKIYLSDKVFDKGRREIALTLMEEAEHIKSQAHDESRQFQNHIFSSWLTSMENSSGLFL